MCLVVTHTLNSGSNVFVPRCLNHREALSAGHDLTQLTAVLNDYPACSPTLQDSHVLSWQESVMTAGHGSTWKPVTGCRNLNKGQIFSGLSSSCPVCHFHLMGLVSFSASLFPCKGRTDRGHTKNRKLFRNKFCSSLPQM